MFERANLRVLRNKLGYTNTELPKRVISAWNLGAQDQLIADAMVVGDRLLVFSCAMEKFEVPFLSIPALNGIAESERSNFIISQEGSYIYWESADIHLDLDALRCEIDPEWNQKLELFKSTHNRIYGKAIAQVRKQHKLRQSEITGVSERHVSRIERGEGTKASTLKLFAQAHGMEFNTYLDAIANAIIDLPDDFSISTEIMS